MRLDPKEIRAGLKDLLEPSTGDRSTRLVIRDALEYIRQLEGDLRRAGFTEYQTGDTDD